MLEKIDFKNGVILSSKVLNELEKATVFNPRFPREDYYGQPTDIDNSIWYITERDGIKDWELSDPSLEPSTNIGRLAYDGLVMGCSNCDLDSTDPIEVLVGPPRLTYRNLDSTPINGSGGVGLVVNSGKFLSSGSETVFWNTTVVVITNTDVTNYIYVDYSDIENPLVVSDVNMPNSADSRVPLARVEIQPFSDTVTTEEERIIYEDLRPGVYIYSDSKTELRNSDTVVTDDQDLLVWERTFVDSANGSVNLTLPTNPVNGDRLAVYDISGTFDLFSVRVYPSSETNHTILSEYDQWELSEKYSHTVFVFYEPLQTWILEQTPNNITSRGLLGEFVSCGGRECIGVVPSDQCVTGTQIRPVFPQESEGIYEYEPTTGKCYKLIKETIGIYSDGDGEFINIHYDPRCLKSRIAPLNEDDRKVIYVDISAGDDSILNSGLNSNQPFRTLERALLESAKRDKPYTIKIAPGEYYIDNSPGVNSVIAPPVDNNYHNFVDLNYAVGRYDSETRKLTISGENQNADNPPDGFTLGRVIYTKNGAFGTITKMERATICYKDCGWKFYLDGVIGSFIEGDELYYNNLSVLNSIAAGVIVPNGTAIVSDNVRGTIIRPMYIPSPDTSVEIKNLYKQTPAILRLTSNSYVHGITFSDSKQHHRTHSGLVSVAFASEQDIIGSNIEELTYSYYRKAGSLLDIKDLETVAILELDTDIVNKSPSDYFSRFEDTIENQTGSPQADYDPDRQLMLNVLPGPIDNFGVRVPDVNSANRGSPYIQNSSVKSIFGLCGLEADGSLVGGFKSILSDGFTIISLQTDPIAFVGEETAIENDPASSISPKQYKSDEKHRHFGYKALNEGYIQASSVYTVGAADHIITKDGGEITVTASTSNFGDIALKSTGYFPRAYAQDFSESSVGYDGTRITEIIPPLPLEDYIDQLKVNTGLKLVLDATHVYYHDNVINGDSTTYRVYVQSANNLIQYDENRPPSADSLGVYNYTLKTENGGYVHAGADDVHRSITVDGTDGRRYVALMRIDTSGLYNTDDSSKVFQYDAEPPRRTISNLGTFVTDEQLRDRIFFSTAAPNIRQLRENNFISIGIYTYQVLEVIENQSNYTVYLDGEIPTDYDTDGIEAKIVSGNTQRGLWYIEVEDLLEITTANTRRLSDELKLEQSSRLTESRPLAIIRDSDTRPPLRKIYRVKLEGYLPSRGIRRPPDNYVVMKQADLDPEEIFNSEDGREPLVITNVQEGDSVGEYFATLVFASDANKSITPELYPQNNVDNIFEGQNKSLTVLAMAGDETRDGFLSREVVVTDTDGNILNQIGQANTVYYVYHSADAGTTQENLRVELRRPSTIRAFAHTWEWVGYLNYDTSLPKYQGLELVPEEYIKKLSTEVHGGRVYSQGMDHAGRVYLNGIEDRHLTTEDLFKAQSQKESILPPDTSTQSMYLDNTLYMAPGSNMIFDNNSRIQFKGLVEFVDESNQVITSDNPSVSGLLSREENAGLIQLATTDELLNNLKTSLAEVTSTKAITPQTLSLAVAAETRYGLVKLATLNETLNGSGGNAVITSENLNNLDASPDQKGLVTLINNISQNDLLTNSESAVTPTSLFNLRATTFDNGYGLVRLATQLEIETGNGGDAVVRSESLSALVANSDRRGIVRLVTTAGSNFVEENIFDAVTPSAILELTATESRAGVIALSGDMSAEGYDFESETAASTAVTPQRLQELTATTERRGVVELADSADIASGDASKVVTAAQLREISSEVASGAQLKYINNLRLSHSSTESYPTYSNDSDQPFTIIYMHGDYISLYDSTAAVWRLTAIPELNSTNIGDPEFFDETNGNSTIEVDTTYYLYAYLNLVSNTPVLVASEVAPQMVSGVMVKIGDSTRRYVGKLRTALSSVSYIQNLGGRLAQEAPVKPQINLVNYENRVKVSLKYLITDAFAGISADQPSPDYHSENIKVSVLCCGDSVVRGRLTALNSYEAATNTNNDFVTLKVYPKLSHNIHGGQSVLLEPENESNIYYTLGQTSANKSVAQSELEFPTSNDMTSLVLTYSTRISYAYDGVPPGTIVVNEGASTTTNIGMIIEAEV